jgi:plasmid maintenance system antidote protein VapI
MQNYINLVKGIHPGFILERELQKRGLGKGKFAISIDEYPQTIGAITKGKRRMNTKLALKIENALSLEDGLLMTLQVFFDIKEAKREILKRPDLSKFRPALFWDTDINKIDWGKQKKAAIKRVFSRGNEAEQKVISEFYGNETILQIINKPSP